MKIKIKREKCDNIFGKYGVWVVTIGIVIICVGIFFYSVILKDASARFWTIMNFLWLIYFFSIDIYHSKTIYYPEPRIDEPLGPSYVQRKTIYLPQRIIEITIHF